MCNVNFPVSNNPDLTGIDKITELVCKLSTESLFCSLYLYLIYA